MRFHIESIEFADLWLNLPLDSDMSVGGITYSFDPPLDPRFEVILLATVSYYNNCWQGAAI